MKIAPMILLCCAVGTRVLAGVENFDSVKPGDLPKGWMGGSSGTGKADWRVKPDATAPSAPNVLEQSGSAKFCWCVNTNLSVTNGRVQVRFMPMAGKEEEAGGLVWRFQDGDNYYSARASSLDGNITIYKTVRGVRNEYGRMDMRVEPRRWHLLRVEFNGPHFTVSFDGEFAVAWDDDTFTNAAHLGVLTVADSVTDFDDFRWEDSGN